MIQVSVRQMHLFWLINLVFVQVRFKLPEEKFFI